MEESGFDFALEHAVDFNIDLPIWPPPPELIDALQGRYPNVQQFPPERDGLGYIQVQQRGRITYEFVTSVQREMSKLAHSFGGTCESWGVMQE